MSDQPSLRPDVLQLVRSKVTRRGLLKSLGVPALIGAVMGVPAAAKTAPRLLGFDAVLPAIDPDSIAPNGPAAARRRVYEVTGNHGCPGIPPFAGGRPPIYLSLPGPLPKGSQDAGHAPVINGHPVPLRAVSEPVVGSRVVTLSDVDIRA